MIRDLEIKGFSPQTVKLYLANVERFAKYYKKSPDLLGDEETKEYLHYLISEKKVSSSYVNSAYSGLKFFYETTLGRQWDMTKIPRSKKVKKLPIVLCQSEVRAILNAVKNIKHKAILMTIYGAGLRVSEAASLKVTDIDSKNMQIRIRQGKGNKDRYSILSQTNLDILREYWKYYRPQVWLFPGSLVGFWI